MFFLSLIGSDLSGHLLLYLLLAGEDGPVISHKSVVNLGHGAQRHHGPRLRLLKPGHRSHGTQSPHPHWVK